MHQGYSAPPAFLLLLGARVREAREKRGWSQRKLAEEASVRQATINDIENGKREPAISTLIQIAGALEVPLISLIPLPPEEGIEQDVLPEWIRRAVKHMKNISNETTQRQIIAMVKAAADTEAQLAEERQARAVLKDLEERIARGEQLPPAVRKHYEKLKDQYGD